MAYIARLGRFGRRRNRSLLGSNSEHREIVKVNQETCKQEWHTFGLGELGATVALVLHQNYKSTRKCVQDWVTVGLDELEATVALVLHKN